MRNFTRIAVALGFVGSIATAGTALAYTGQEYAKDAKITMAEATAIALKAQPGTVTDQELEREGGGSGLRYSFDITSAGVAREVGVDAVTGKILENSLEGKDSD